MTATPCSLIVVAGATASGKTALAVELCRRFGELTTFGKDAGGLSRLLERVVILLGGGLRLRVIPGAQLAQLALLLRSVLHGGDHLIAGVVFRIQGIRERAHALSSGGEGVRIDSGHEPFAVVTESDFGTFKAQFPELADIGRRVFVCLGHRSDQNIFHLFSPDG